MSLLRECLGKAEDISLPMGTASCWGLQFFDNKELNQEVSNFLLKYLNDHDLNRAAFL